MAARHELYVTRTTILDLEAEIENLRGDLIQRDQAIQVLQADVRQSDEARREHQEAATEQHEAALEVLALIITPP